MNKKIIYVILMALLLTLGFGIFAARPTKEICTSNIDCGFDVGRTDFKDIKSRGYPFISRKTEVTREYDKNTFEVITKTSSTFDITAFALNTLCWSVLTFALFFYNKIREKNANYRH